MRTRGTAMLLCAGVLLTACGPDIPLDLNLRSVAITVPRLLTPAIELVEPPATPPPVSLPPPPSIPAVPPAPPAPPPPPTAPPPPPPPPVCPPAGPFDVPELSAWPIVDTIPVEATFEQHSEITYTQSAVTDAGSDDEPATEVQSDTVEVVVTALEPTTSRVGQRIDAWAVQRTERDTGATSVEVYRLVHPHDSPLATDSGIYLTGMSWQDELRGNLVFEPVGEGLWLLPSPVVFAPEDGVQYVRAAVDPATLTTLAIVRNVTGRKRVDACGDLIDTMTVEITGLLTTTTRQFQVDWTLQFATSYGGLDVEQTLALTSHLDGFSWVRTTRNVALPEVPA